MKKFLKQKLSQNRIIRKVYRLIKGVQPNLMVVSQENLLKEMMPSDLELEQMIKESQQFKFQPLISVIMPTYNTDLKMLDEAIESVQKQAYSNWELVAVDDASPNAEVREKLTEYSLQDKRIKTVFLDKNHHIAGATNKGFEASKGDYIALFDHDDYLYPNALYENVKRINQQREVKFLYSDEDKIDEFGNRHFDAYLKPDFNFDFLRCMNVITHFVVFKRELWTELGGEDAKYNGAQDWEFVMRLTSQLKQDEIQHIAKVIYSWRVHSGSTAMEMGSKPYVPEAQRNLLGRDLKNREQFATKIYENHEALGQWLFQYPVLSNPLITIKIDSASEKDQLEKLLNSIYIKTSYYNFELLITTESEKTQALVDKYKAKHDNIVDELNGDYVAVISPNFEILTSDWIEKLLGQVQRSEIAYAMPRIVGEEINIVESTGLAVTNEGEIINLLNGFNTIAERTLTEHIHLTTHHAVTGINSNFYMTSREIFEKEADPVLNSIRLGQGNSSNIFVTDVQVRNNGDILDKSLGNYKELINFQDRTVNSNFLLIEQNFKRGEKI